MNIDPLTLKNLMCLFAADVDLSLLKEVDQETDKDHLYSKDEIRNQLAASTVNLVDTLEKLGFNVDRPLRKDHIPTLKG